MIGCLRYPEFQLPDGSVRTTFASEAEEYPPCLQSVGAAISGEFNLVFGAVSQLFQAVAGEASLQWRAPGDSQPNQFSELPKKVS